MTSAIWRPSAVVLPAAVSAGSGATSAGTAIERVLAVSNSTSSGSSSAGIAGVCACAASGRSSAASIAMNFPARVCSFMAFILIQSRASAARGFSI